MLLFFKKMKNTSFFLSNEQYSTFRRQKLTKVEGFKAHTAKNNGFFRIFMTFCSQRVTKKALSVEDGNFNDVRRRRALPFPLKYFERRKVSLQDREQC